MRAWMAGVLAAGWIAACFAGVAQAAPSLPDFKAGTPEQRQAQECALTFDDGPGPHTGALLDELGKAGVKATFFVLGEHVRRYPDLIRRMVAEGHEVENHSWDHPDMRKLSPDQRRKEIEDTMALLNTLGVYPHFFRPPYGAYDPELVEESRRQGLTLVLWTHDSVDWRYHTVADMESHALPPGEGAHGVFLFHDIHDSTIAAMPEILRQLAERGCRFVTVAQWAEHNGTAHLAAPTLREASSPALAPRQKDGVAGWLKDWLH